VKRLLLIFTIFFFLLIGKAREIKQRDFHQSPTQLFFYYFFFIFQVGRFNFYSFFKLEG
jgi:hypothetical protein